MIQEATVNVLRKYTDAFYRMRRERWDSRHMVYETLDANGEITKFFQPLPVR